jgi:hypothetical protein
MNTDQESPLEMMCRQASMTREERQKLVEENERTVAGMLRWIEQDGREPTEREREKLQGYRSLIASVKLGLENESKGL